MKLLIGITALLIATGPLRAQGEVPRLPSLDPKARAQVPAPEDDEIDDPESLVALPDPGDVSRETVARDTDLALEAKRANRVLDRHTPRSRWEKTAMVLSIIAAAVIALFVWFVRSLRSRQA